MTITGKHIAAARALLGISQADLAEATGLAANTILMFETGQSEPRSVTVDTLRRVLEERGIEFSNGDSPGVKLHRKRQRSESAA
jgi:transcriptional regulator with XRE-family HTH domain